MEHRWGQRMKVRLPVRLVTAFGVSDNGTLRNVSASGALIDTGMPEAVPGLVHVELPGEALIAAFVVRRTKGGIAVEWSDYAPEAVERVLMIAPLAQAAGKVPAIGAHVP